MTPKLSENPADLREFMEVYREISGYEDKALKISVVRKRRDLAAGTGQHTSSL